MTTGVWRHSSCLDLDMWVLQVSAAGPKRFKVTAKLFNRHNFYLYETGDYLIEASHLSRWRRVA